MLFELFEQTAKKYHDNFAINYETYKTVLDKVLSNAYHPVATNTGYDIIIDILTAARDNKPLVIPPKYNQDQCLPPINIPVNKFGIVLYSSGSTGSQKKPYFIPESVLLQNTANAIDLQKILSTDVIYTVCSMNHTGGINMQTLPGLLTGSHIILDNFTPYTFLKSLNEHKITITHLVPIMIDVLTKLKNQLELKYITRVVAGSDCINENYVSYWLKKNVNFIMNYGLTQAGPVIINHEFSPGDNLDIFNHGVPLGTNIWCDYDLKNSELLLNGTNVAHPGWLYTDDCVIKKENWFMYQGRISAGCKIIPKKY